MTYKAASFLIVCWGIFTLAGGAIAFYFMGSVAMPLLVMVGLAGALSFSVGHFLNRQRKQAFILALATCLLFVLLLGWLTARAFSAEQNLVFADAWAAHPRPVSLLVNSALFTGTVFTLAVLLIFAKSIYASFGDKPAAPLRNR